MWVPRQEVGQVLFGDYACMHAVLCCAVHTIYFHLSLCFLPCECVCIYYLLVTAEGRYMGTYRRYLTHYTVIPILYSVYCLFCSKRGKLVLFR